MGYLSNIWTDWSAARKLPLHQISVCTHISQGISLIMRLSMFKLEWFLPFLTDLTKSFLIIKKSNTFHMYHHPLKLYSRLLWVSGCMHNIGQIYYKAFFILLQIQIELSWQPKAQPDQSRARGVLAVCWCQKEYLLGRETRAICDPMTGKPFCSFQ